LLSLPPLFVSLLNVFAPLFSDRVWRHAQVLLIGALLAPGRRTVTSCLRIVGLGRERHFVNYHRVLSRARWRGREASRLLLDLLVNRFVPAGPIVLGIDDTIERRRGKRIQAKGIYRDPVRSSHSHFVKASGLRWVSLMLLAPVPWAARTWALPFLTCLAPSERYRQKQRKQHKPLLAWARQMIWQAQRWLPNRELVVVGDSAFSALEWLSALVRRNITVVTRLRLDAALYDPAPVRRPGTNGRPRKRRKATAHPAAGMREESHALATPARAGLVWRRRSCHCGLQPHGGLVSHRLASRADSLGTDPRSGKALRSTSPAVYGSDPEPAHDRVLVCATLASRGHLSGSAKSSRGRNPATMESTSHCPNHTVFARTVFFGDLARRPTRPSGHTAAATGCLVQQVTTHLCRCLGRGTSALLEADGFSRLWSQRADAKTTQHLARVPHLCTLPCCLMAKGELRQVS
jgi:hypothetical protein